MLQPDDILEATGMVAAYWAGLTQQDFPIPITYKYRVLSAA